MKSLGSVGSVIVGSFILSRMERTSFADMRGQW
jgi:hypothetical protein